MAWWLVKSEPDEYSIGDLEADGTASWDGVRNYEARNNLRAMKRGDRVFVYHSNAKPPCLAGLAEVAREAYPDPTQHDAGSDGYDARSPAAAPRWSAVDLRFVSRYARPVPLAELRAEPALAGLALVRRGSRLSVMPVSAGEARALERLARRGPGAGTGAGGAVSRPRARRT